MIRKFLLALCSVIALSLSSQHCAALEVSLSPDPPMTGDAAVVVFSTIGDRCVIAAPREIAVHVEASVLIGELEIVDVCDIRARPESVELPLGEIPPDVHTLEVRACTNVPPGQPRCSPILVKGVAGGGLAAQPTAVPAESLAGLVVMALAMLLLGLLFLPLTRRSSGR